jgi:uncharacterized protein YegP (UPF0339 family)
LDRFDSIDIDMFAPLLEEQVGVKVIGTSVAGVSASYDNDDEQGTVTTFDIHTIALVFTTTEPEQDELIDDDVATTFVDTNHEYVKAALDAASDTVVELLNSDDEEEGDVVMADAVELYKDHAGEWRWRRFAENGEEIGASTEGYKNRADCIENAKMNGITFSLDDEKVEDEAT